MTAVLIISTSYPTHLGHGSGTFVHHQARALGKLGHRVTVLCPATPGAAGEEEMEGVSVRRFRYAPRSMEGLAYGGGIPANLSKRPWLWGVVPGFMLAMVRATRALARSADLIHAHWTPAALAARCVAGRPVVVSFHGSELMSGGRAMRRAAVMAAKAAGAVVVHGREMAKKARELGLPAEKIHLIPHGVDLGSAGFCPPEHEGKIVFLGRLSREKGPDLLLRAYALLPPAAPDLLMIGPGPMKGELDALAAELGIDGRVEFAGETPHPRAMGILREASLVVVPSRREGFGLSCLEAMAAGRAVVATRCGGPEDLVTDGENGLLVPVGDVEALAGGIVRLLEDRNLAEQLGAMARRRAAENYNPEVLVHRLETVYASLLSPEIFAEKQ